MKKIGVLLVLILSSCLGFSQIIYTVAGNGTAGYGGDAGFAVYAQIIGYDIAVDASGNIYIADLINHRIRKVTASTGKITTIAGTGMQGYNGEGIPATSAQLSNPCYIALDGLGNIYISERSPYRVRKITASTGLINTVAGTGLSLYNGDGIPATSANISPRGLAVDNNGNIFIVDVGNFRIRKVTASTGIISTVAGTGSYGYGGNGGLAIYATFKDPADVAIDGSGNIYIVDSDPAVVRKITASTGIINTVVGTGAGGYNGDGIPATSAQLYWPRGIALDASGNIFIADGENHRIRKVTASTGIINTIAGNGTPAFSGDGGLATLASLKGPEQVFVNPSGDIYLGDFYNRRIRVVSSTCPVNAGPNVINQQDICGIWPGVQIGTPAVPNMTYAWSPNVNLSSATIAQPTSTWKTPNTSKLYTLQVSGANCITASSTVGVTALPNTCIGCCKLTNNNLVSEKELSFSVYPSPGNGNVTIGLYNNAEYIRVMDMQGRIVFETENISTPEFKLDISSYTRGVYVVIAKIGDAIEKQKIIVE